MKTVRRIGTILAAVAGLGLVAPVAAEAGTVSVTWGCGTFGGPSGIKTFEITVTAPATATAGQTVTVHIDVLHVTPWGPAAAAGTYTGRAGLDLGGAASGHVQAYNLTNPEIAAGAPFRMTGGTVQVTLPTAGQVTFATTGYVQFAPSGMWFSCGGGAAPVAATTQVS
ncbi:hypothetical protein [Amycolatopsis sp.]|uniref:hypothetical protein n=1 Tax=Amycolatopsis sp. TaxID=37632 RepID=UPI002D8005F4|nr:hypothetical protein [Amycolatopsis sp.]HET6707187.1 hypothetical protein [Amycolatopsis sp.]